MHKLRRMQNDLPKTWKILTQLDKVDCFRLARLSSLNMRTEELKFHHPKDNESLNLCSRGQWKVN